MKDSGVEAYSCRHQCSALRKKGRPVPTNDLWIAASALQHGYAVFSFDKHFGEMENLIVGSQLEDFLP